MDQVRTDSLHTAPTFGPARSPRCATGPETVSTWAAATARHDVPGPTTAPGSAGTAWLRSREVLVGAAAAVAALGLATAIVLSGSADEPPSGAATLAPAPAVAAPIPCEGDVHTLTGRIVTARRGSGEVPVGVVAVSSTTTCRAGEAAGGSSPIPVSR